MKLYGLLGKRLSHSFSKSYFTEKFINENNTNALYENFEIDKIDDFQRLVEKNNFSGLNVTIPYKTEIIKYIDELDTISEKIQSVNTLKFIDNKIVGYNTDYYGFKNSFCKLLQPTHKSAIIFGTGGSSKTIAYVLNELNIKVLFVSRAINDNNIITYQNLSKEIIKNNQIFINTSPVGMFPCVNEVINIDYSGIDSSNYLFDLIYNPLETNFIKEGIKRKSIVKNGIEMFQMQAEKSWQIWNT